MVVNSQRDNKFTAHNLPIPTNRKIIAMSDNADISRQSRIPFTLQAVFLASNRGKDVHKPPPENAGSKVFKKNWFLQRQAKEKKNKLKTEGSPAESPAKKTDKRKAEKGVSDVSFCLSTKLALFHLSHSHPSTARQKPPSSTVPRCVAKKSWVFC